MKLFISAAETSSDQHAAEWVKAFKKITTKPVQLIGVGGPALESQGLHSLQDIKKISAMGFSEVLPRLWNNILLFYQMLQTIQKEKPDVILLFDYPGLHLKLAQKIYKKWGIPLIYFIPPKVWAWKKKRIWKLKKYCDLVFIIFPFEVELYRKCKVPFFYIGNPLLDQLPFQKTKTQAREELQLPIDATVITVLLGSRQQEIKSHFEIVIEALFSSLPELKERLNLSPSHPLQCVFPFPDKIGKEWVQSLLEEYLNSHPQFLEQNQFIKFHFLNGFSHEALLAADAGLIKSGTSTLEAGLLGCPHVLFYKVSKISEFIFKNLIRYHKPVGLVNLALGIQNRTEAPFRELLGFEGFTAHKIKNEILELLFSESRKSELAECFNKLKNVFSQKKSPSENAALHVLEFIQKRELKKQNHLMSHSKNSIIFPLISVVWSSVNFLRRNFLTPYFFKLKKIEAKVYSVGNIQAGGAGKTPFVIALAQKWVAEGKNGVILTRGVGSQVEKKGAILFPFQKDVSAEMWGDEPKYIHDKVPEVTIGVGKNRWHVYQKIKNQTSNKIDFVILEDGFQNFQIHVDVSIVLLTSLQRKNIPYRDFQSELKKADEVYWTKGERRPSVPKEVALLDVSYEVVTEGQWNANDEVILITAVSDNDSVREYITSKGVKIKEHLKFKDHYSFQNQALHNKMVTFIQSKNKIAVTQKDWMKLKKYFLDYENAFVRLDLQVKLKNT